MGEPTRSNLITHMGEMKRLHHDVERAMKIQHGDYLDRLAIHWKDDHSAPPAVCSTLPGCPLLGEEYRLPGA
jgi:hypothetical protein